MPTTNKTTSSSSTANTYNPQSMSLFNQFSQQGGNVLQQDMQNPQQQMAFNQNLAQGNQNAFNLANRNNQNIQSRAGAWGGAQTPGFLQNQLGQSGNQLSANQNQNFNQNLMYSDQLRQSAMSQALGYHPLQTGGTQQGSQTQSTGGVGSWAGPLISAGMSVATGGLSNMFGSAPLGGAAAQQMGLQGNNMSMFSGQGDMSSIQPSMMQSSNTLNPWNG